MKEIKCPKCGEVFQIDEGSYIEIANQIKNKEFEKELDDRVRNVKEKLEAQQAQELEKAKSEIKQLEIEKKSLEEKQQINIDAEVAKANEKSGKTISTLEKEIEKIKGEKTALEQNQKSNINAEVAKANEASTKTISTLEKEIEKIKGEKIALEQSKEKDIEIAENKIKLAAQTELNKKDKEISDLKSEFSREIRDKDEEIAHYKENKAKLSVKLLGENLEQHCLNVFNQIRAIAFPNAYFEKDNEISETGSKGDFIFRDKDGEQEYISIMFEMKNESDVSKTKHKNEDFFKELDKDRREKKCEYAVLVSMLEPESDLYNAGIVDVSHKYKKMYVIRPQFFIPLISLLVNAAKNSISYQKQLAEAKCQNLDINNFEDKLSNWQKKFGRNFQLATDRYAEAIGKLKKMKDSIQTIIDTLEVSQGHLIAANNDAKDISIKKLTKDNPTMKAKFGEIGFKEEEDK